MATETSTLTPQLKTPAGVRSRAIAEQVKQLRYAAEQAWGSPRYQAHLRAESENSNV